MLGIYFILGLVMLTLPSIALVSDRDTMTKITVWWFTFGIAAIIEFCIFLIKNTWHLIDVRSIVRLLGILVITIYQKHSIVKYGQMEGIL